MSSLDLATPPAPLHPPAYRATDPLMAFVALSTEAAIVAAVLHGRIDVPIGLAAHGLVLIALALRLALAARLGHDAGPAMLLLPAVAFAGPFGALGCLCLGRLARHGDDDVERLEAWYRRISLSTEMDPTARLADHVATGRALDFDRLPSAPMIDLIESGAVSEKQSILGIIARRFHPDHLPTLKRALLSEEPVIRVQAAAVAAKIRGDMPAIVDRLLEEAADASAPPTLILRRVNEAKMCVGSGLLEAKNMHRAERLIDGIMARTLLRLERMTKDHPAGIDSMPEAVAPLLLANGRYADFRRLRRAEVWASRGPWIYRPLPRTARRSEEPA